MTLTTKDLTAMRAGWQKVVDRGQYGSTIYVFRFNEDRIMAVTNRNQGVGELIETITATTPISPCPADAMPARGEPVDYGVLYEGTNPFGDKA